MTSGRRVFGLFTALVLLVLLAVSASSPLPASADAGLTTTYLHDDARDGYYASETAISAATAPTITVQAIASHGLPGGSTQPIDAGSVLYWSDGTGILHATSDSTGIDVWTYQLGTTASSCFGTAGPDSTPTVATVNGVSTVLLGGGTGQFLALNAATGNLLWQDQLTTSSAGFVWSSPLLYNGSIYIGVASVADCPLVPGELFRLDAATGATQATFTAVPPGCTGATIWSSPTVDDATGEIFVDTGNGDGSCPQPEPYQEAMIRLDPITLAVQDSWQTEPNTDAGDTDFGATPTLFTATLSGLQVPMVGAMNKDGYYYAFRRDNLAAGPVWTQYFATPGQACVDCTEDFLAPSAWDGTHLYVGGNAGQINGQACTGSLSALDAATGSPIWQDCLAGPVMGAVTAAPGIVEANAGNQALIVDAASGQNLFTFTDPSGYFFLGPAAFFHGDMYAINQDGNVYSFAPGPPISTPEAPMAFFLPVAGVAVSGGVVALRRRRSGPTPATALHSP